MVSKNRKPLTREQKRLKERLDMYNLVKKNVNKVNSRLASLERGGFKAGTWASKKLVSRLDSKILKSYNKKTRRVKLNKNLSMAQLRTVNKSLTNFLGSETSRKSGIKSVRKRTIESLQKTLSDVDNELSYEDAEALYDMLGDNDFSTLVDKIGASAMWALVDDAIDANDSLAEFQIRMGIYLDNVKFDDDMYERISRLYDKYVE